MTWRSVFHTSDGLLRSPWRLALYLSLVILFMALFWFEFGSWFSFFPSQFLFHSFLLLSAVGAGALCALLIDKEPANLLGAPLSWRTVGRFCLGLLFAVLLIALLCLGLYLFGQRWIRGLEGDALIRILVSGTLLALLVSLAEEILYRGYPWRILAPLLGPWGASAAISAFFSVGHVFNPYVSPLAAGNIFLAGVWLGRARHRSGSLWQSIGMHMGWNLLLGPVLGFSISGLLDDGMWKPVGTLPTLISGGYFGPEGGLLATVVLVIGIMVTEWQSARDRKLEITV